MNDGEAWWSMTAVQPAFTASMAHTRPLSRTLSASRALSRRHQRFWRVETKSGQGAMRAMIPRERPE